MKAAEILDILDLTMRIRERGGTFNPLFVGPPGIGKSKIIQQWCKEQDIPFIDIRAAYKEAPDMIGFPFIIELPNGKKKTSHCTPDFWPDEGKGVIFLDELNRGTTSVMNTFMQILTDRMVDKHKIPDGWIIVSAINPEDSNHDVNTMDAALRNRFAIFEVNYDQKTFLEYMKESLWDESVVLFVESNIWKYVDPNKVADNPGTKYVSPRDLAVLNDVCKDIKDGKLTRDAQLPVFESILGKSYGIDFYSFLYQQRPVRFKELVDDPKEALNRLKAYSDPKDYKNSLISVTIRDILQDGTITDELLASVILALPADQAVGLVRELEYNRKDETIITRLFKEYPKVKERIKDTLKAK